MKILKSHENSLTRILLQVVFVRKKFSQHNSLNNHIEMNGNMEPIDCNLKKNISPNQNSEVLGRIHPVEKPYECDICKKLFSLNKDLKRHMRGHAGEKPYQCDICTKSFSHSWYLKIHMSIHTGEKSFKCDICIKSFSHIGALKRHMIMHTGEKPYECDICKKSFSQNSNLKSHMRTHTCNICKEKFLWKRNLESHMTMHTGENPYECDVCKQLFTSSAGLKSHMKVHKCNVCKEKFFWKIDLERHMTIHTGNMCPNSRALVVSSSGSSKKCGDTQLVSEDGNGMSCIKEQILVGSDNKDYSKHKVVSHGGIDTDEDDSSPAVGSDVQLKKSQIHLSENKIFLMASVEGNNDDNDSRHLEANLEDPLEEISVKEEIDIHEIPFEDQYSEEFNNHSFTFKSEAACDDF